MANFFIFLSVLVLPSFLSAHVAVAGNSSESSFLQCFLNETTSRRSTSQAIYAPNTTSYDEVLLSSVRNIRFFSGNTTKPSFVVLPSNTSGIQAAVSCGRRHGLRLRVRSGGHDYEGQSYVSTALGSPFILLDLSNLRSVVVDYASGTAWVAAGATVGEVYYNVGVKNRTAAFPAGICTTIGVGGHFSGGGIGALMRKYGLSADNIVDAVMVNATGAILDRASMGEDVFWAIRGGGATSFGVVLGYKITLVDVPPQVAVFNVSRTLKQGATALVERWQRVAPQLVDELWIRAMLMATDDEAEPGNRTMTAIFQGMYLGRRQEMLSEMEKSFPELGLKAEDFREMSWVESTLYFDGHDIKNPTLLLDRKRASNSSFKAKSDFVREPISEKDWEVIWKLMVEGKDEPVVMILEPWGGKVGGIPETAIAFPHRKGNLYNIQYFMKWVKTGEAVTERHLEWMRKLYELMTPFVSSNPRAAYLNYKDIDLGSSKEEGRTGYKEASAWGNKYYLSNYERLAKVKAKVDPDNYFWNEQSIPPFSAA